MPFLLVAYPKEKFKFAFSFASPKLKKARNEMIG